MNAIRLWRTVLIGAVVSSAIAASPPETIRGLEWGGSLSALGDSTLTEDDGALKCYRKNGDDLTVGAAVLNSIIYCYYKDRLDAVFIKFKGYSNFSNLKSTLSQKYGAGEQPNEFMQKYQWTVSNVFIVFNYNEIGQTGELNYIFKPIAAEQGRDEQEQQKKGEDKL